MLFELDKSNTIKVCQSGAILAGSCQDEWLKQPFMYKLGWDDTRTIYYEHIFMNSTNFLTSSTSLSFKIF